MYRGVRHDVRHLLFDAARRVHGRGGTWDRAEAALERALKLRDASYKLNPGDGAFYGPKLDFEVTDAIGPQVAVRHGAAGLPDAAALRLDVRGPGRPAQAARHDPPGHYGQPGAVHRHFGGALRRGVSALAGAGAGHGSSPSPTTMCAMPRRCREHSWPRPVSGWSWMTATKRSATKSVRRRCKKCRTCWWSAAKKPESGTVAVRHRRHGGPGRHVAADLLQRMQQEIETYAQD